MADIVLAHPYIGPGAESANLTLWGEVNLDVLKAKVRHHPMIVAPTVQNFPPRAFLPVAISTDG
eukprot:90060-Hanusia_phi.AAC.1